MKLYKKTFKLMVPIELDIAVEAEQIDQAYAFMQSCCDSLQEQMNEHLDSMFIETFLFPEWAHDTAYKHGLFGRDEEGNIQTFEKFSYTITVSDEVEVED